MREVWILADDLRAQKRLNLALEKTSLQETYTVQTVAKIEEIPERVFVQQNVSFLLDAFSAHCAGFEGLRLLRDKGFVGPVYLMGEPAAIDAQDPFVSYSLTAFVPPVDRFDPEFVVGLIHSKFSFGDGFSPKQFLQKGAKSSTETVKNIQVFNQLVMKLSNFVSRFGVDAHQIKRLLVALSSAHVKSVSGAPRVLSPFKLSYGLDSQKLVLAVYLDGTHVRKENVLKDFVQILVNFKNDHSPRVNRNDFLNVAKITNNLFYFGGSVQENDVHEHCFMTAIPLSVLAGKGVDFYSFGFIWAQPFNDEASKSLDSLFEPTLIGDEVSENLPEFRNEEVLPSSEDVSESKESDTEVESEIEAELGLEVETSQSFSSSTQLELEKKIEALEKELFDEKKMAEILVSDVKRLMKERRMPITEGELRESLNELNLRFERVREQNERLQEMLSQKESQIEMLKAQVDRLKSSAA